MDSNFYSSPSNMAGGYVVYSGYRRQRGAGVFGSIRRYMAPIGKQAWSGLKTAGTHAARGVKRLAKTKLVQDIAKKAAETGAEVLSGVAVDALQGRNVGESIKSRGRDVLLNKLTGGPAPPPPPPQAAKSRKWKKKLKQKKRSAASSTNFLQQAPPAKKRRRVLSRAALNRKQLF